MRTLTAAAAALVLQTTLLAAQDVAGHLAAADAARCRRDPQAALMHLREALALDSLNYEANWRAARALTDVGKMTPDAQKARRDSVYAEAREIEALAGGEHAVQQAGDLLALHAAEEAGHQQRRQLVVGHAAGFVGREQVAQLGGREGAAVALAFDQSGHKHYSASSFPTRWRD